jgi:hypothetical protein
LEKNLGTRDGDISSISDFRCIDILYLYFQIYRCSVSVKMKIGAICSRTSLQLNRVHGV